MICVIAEAYRDGLPSQIDFGNLNAPQVTRSEFEKLRYEVEELKALLKAAKRFDVNTGQQDCEHEEKIKIIRKVAEFVGVDIVDVFK